MGSNGRSDSVTVLSGSPTIQEGGRPWMFVDARDVAEAKILLHTVLHAHRGAGTKLFFLVGYE